MLMTVPHNNMNPLVFFAYLMRLNCILARQMASASVMLGSALSRLCNWPYLIWISSRSTSKPSSISDMVRPGRNRIVLSDQVCGVGSACHTPVVGSFMPTKGYASNAHDISTMPHEVRFLLSVSNEANLDMLNSCSVVLVSLNRGTEQSVFATRNDTSVQCFVCKWIQPLIPPICKRFASFKDAMRLCRENGKVACTTIKQRERK